VNLSFPLPANIQYNQEKWLTVEFWSCSYAVFSYKFEKITKKTIIPQVSFLNNLIIFLKADEAVVQWLIELETIWEI
jgi:hypothetical protein